MASSLPKLPEWVTEMLTSQQSFLQYHSYHSKVRHNHKPHGIGAMAVLGASQEKVQKYCDANKDLILPMDGDSSKDGYPEQDRLQSSNIADYKGANQAFYKIHDHYAALLKDKYNGDHHALIRGELPDIIDGPMFSAFHGVIHVAYGLLGNSAQTVVEGLGYTFQQYSAFNVEGNKATDTSRFGKGKTEIIDLLKEIKDSKIYEQIAEQKQKDMEMMRSTYKIGLYGWVSLTYHSERFLDWCDSVKLPDWFDVTKEDMEQIYRLADWFLDMTIIVYVAGEHVNDLFLLHGVTSAWSLRHVLQYFDYPTALRAMRAEICGVLMTYAEQGSPELKYTPEDYYKGNTVTQADWDKVNKSMVDDNRSFDAHVYKVAQCCYNRWQSDPDSPYAKHMIAGAELSYKHVFARGPKGTDPIVIGE